MNPELFRNQPPPQSHALERNMQAQGLEQRLQELDRFNRAVDIMLKQTVVPPEFGTDLDPNRAGNIYDVVEKEARRDKDQAYWDAEFAPLREGLDADGADWYEAFGRMLELRKEGVTANEDGTYDLKADGQSATFNRDGVPVEDKKS